MDCVCVVVYRLYNTKCAIQRHLFTVGRLGDLRSRFPYATCSAAFFAARVEQATRQFVRVLIEFELVVF